MKDIRTTVIAAMITMTMAACSNVAISEHARLEQETLNAKHQAQVDVNDAEEALLDAKQAYIEAQEVLGERKDEVAEAAEELEEAEAKLEEAIAKFNEVFKQS